MIEDPEAVEQAEAIVAMPEIDGCTSAHTMSAARWAFAGRIAIPAT